MPLRVSVHGCSRRVWFAALLLLIVCPLFVSLYPQDTTETPKLERNRQTKPDLESRLPKEAPQKEKGYTIGVNVDLVLIYASVFDKSGRFLPGLKKDNFKLFEDGVQQNLTSFAQEDVPVSMGILLDLSGSMRGKIDQVNKAVAAMFKKYPQQN